VENKFAEVLTAFNPEIRIMSHGSSLEIYKEVGLPEQVTERFHTMEMSGRHGIGHTRMATESAVTTLAGKQRYRW
jgi:amidophosphoribosyltransferase